MTEEKFEISRRKVLAGTGAIGAAAAGTALGTNAFFNDEEGFDGNLVQAGTLDLFVGYEYTADQGSYDGNYSGDGLSGTVQNDQDTNGAAVGFSLDDVKPGDSGTLELCPRVVDNPAWVWIGSENGVVDFENGQNEPEADVDATGGDPGQGQGELSEAIQVTVSYYDSSGNHVRDLNNPSDYTLADLSNDLERGFLLDGQPAPSNPGTQAYPPSSASDVQTGPCLHVDLDVPESVGNEIQSDSCELDIEFYAEQERHNGVPANPFADTFVTQGGSIQDAVDNASDGDVIGVAPGTFSESVAVSGVDDLTIAGSGAGATTIDGSGNQDAIRVDGASGLTVCGVTLTNDSGANNDKSHGLLAVGDADGLTVCNTIVENITALTRATGIAINVDPNNGTSVGDASGAKITNNIIRGLSTTEAQPNLSAPYDESKAKGIALNGTVEGAEISFNTIDTIGDTNSTYKPRGITLTEDGDDNGPTNFEIVNNDISAISGVWDNPAIFIGGLNGIGSDSHVNLNNLLRPVDNLSGQTVDVTQNWWGQAGGPSLITSDQTHGTGAITDRNGGANYDASSPLGSDNGNAGSTL